METDTTLSLTGNPVGGSGMEPKAILSRIKQQLTSLLHLALRSGQPLPSLFDGIVLFGNTAVKQEAVTKIIDRPCENLLVDSNNCLKENANYENYKALILRNVRNMDESLLPSNAKPFKATK